MVAVLVRVDHPHHWTFSFQGKTNIWWTSEKQIRDHDCHLLWSGSQCLKQFQILRICMWTMAYHGYNLCGWKLGHLEELIPSEFHSSQKESFWLRSRCETSEMPWSVLDLIENFTRYSTTCSCAPYCEVELLRPVAYIWPSEPSLWFCTWGVLCEYSSEFYIEVLIWGNKDLNLFIQAADKILIKWNYVLSYVASPLRAWQKPQSEFQGETSNSSCLLHDIIPISSVWSWDAHLNSIWSI